MDGEVASNVCKGEHVVVISMPSRLRQRRVIVRRDPSIGVETGECWHDLHDLVRPAQKVHLRNSMEACVDVTC